MAISSPEMMLVPVTCVSCGCEERMQRLSCTEIDVTKTATTNFASDAVLVAHTEILVPCQRDRKPTIYLAVTEVVCTVGGPTMVVMSC